MKQIKGGITVVPGFEAAAAAAQIKYEGRTDMALIYSSVPCVAAGTFTTNVVKAAPVKWDQKIVKQGGAVQAIIVNSGIANAGDWREDSDDRCDGQRIRNDPPKYVYDAFVSCDRCCD